MSVAETGTLESGNKTYCVEEAKKSVDDSNKENIQPKRKEMEEDEHEEKQYLNLIKRIIRTGKHKGDRTCKFMGEKYY